MRVFASLETFPLCLLLQLILYYYLFFMRKTKDFTQVRVEESEDNLRIQAPVSSQEKMSKKLKFLYLFLIISLLIGIGINFFAPTVLNSNYEDFVQSETDNTERMRAQQQELKMLEQFQIQGRQKYPGKIAPLSKKVKQRISYGQPRRRNSTLRAIIIQKKESPTSNSICALTNGVTIISSKSIETAKNLLNQKDVYKWIVFLPKVDIISDGLINGLSVNNVEKKQIKQVIVDSNYQFITNLTAQCASVVYMQNTFVVKENQAKNIVESAKKLKEQKNHSYLGYSQQMTYENVTKKFQVIKQSDISQFQQKTFNQYLYIFDAKFFNVITPLNFMHFAKYTLEQILIYPIVALLKNTDNLVPLKGSLHSFDQVYIQFKQFALRQHNSNPQSKSYCFVSYPSRPDKIISSQLQAYLNSIDEIEKQNSLVYSVIYLRYGVSDQEKSLYQAYNLIRELKIKNPNMNIRLRIKLQSAESSLAAYQSAHTYCADESIMITSRHNINLQKNIISEISQKLSQKYHYYYSGTGQINKLLSSTKERFNIDQFISQMSTIQIFKSHLMKMINVWVLKSSQQKFFQTQASFTVPLLQMAGGHISQLSLVYKGTPRTATNNESEQIKKLKTYSRWNILKDNILKPLAYNSLTNLDLRRGNLQPIPKIIHQIWFKDQPIPDVTKALQRTIKEVNKDYKYLLWGKENLTYYDFPMSYALVAKTLEYEWAQNRNMHKWVQAIFSYEVLYNHGGFYLSLNVEGKKPLDQFLKYQIIFSGYTSDEGYYDYPHTVGRSIIGCQKYNYYMRMVLTQIITEQRVDFDYPDYEAIVGGDVLRISMTDDELFTGVAFGFYLFNYQPFEKPNQLCNGEQIPCKGFEQAYIVVHNLKN